MRHAAERPIVSDHRRKKALDEVADVVKFMMSKNPMLAVVRSTIWLGESMWMSLTSLSEGDFM